MDPWMDAAHRGATALAERGQAPVQARGTMNADDPASVHGAAAAGVSGSGGALPHLDRIQAAFGGNHDLSQVRAHVGGAAAAASEYMGAEAYATGAHVAFRSQPDLHTVAHEAAHVVQQRASGFHLSGNVGRAGDSYERHADAVADLVVQGQSAAPLLDHLHAGSGGGRSDTAAVQGLGGNIGRAKPLARFGPSRDTVAEELAVRDEIGGRRGQTKKVERDANHNNKRRVEYENGLAKLILTKTSLYQDAVHNVSTRIVAYIKAKVGDTESAIEAELKKLIPRPDDHIFGRLLAESPEAYATQLLGILQDSSGDIINHFQAHAAFITNIYEKDSAADLEQLKLRIEQVTGTSENVRGATRFKDEQTRIALGIGGSLNYDDAHKKARLDPQSTESAYEKNFHKEVPTTEKISGLNDRQRQGGEGRGSNRPRKDAQPPALTESMAQTHKRGTDQWTANEESPFVQDARMVLDMPVSGTGASGNTAELMNCAVIFGLSEEALKKYALGVVGYLIGGGAHSFHEIMSIATQAPGIHYTPGHYEDALPAALKETSEYRELATTYRDDIQPVTYNEPVKPSSSVPSEEREPSSYKLPGFAATVELKESERDSWTAKVKSFLATELGIEEETLAVTPLAGGRTGDPVYRVAVADRALGVFKVFSAVEEAENEVKMLRLLHQKGIATVDAKGLGRVTTGGVEDKAGLLMGMAPGRSIDAMVASLPSDETRGTALDALETAIRKTAEYLASFHKQLTGKEKVSPNTKKFELEYLNKKIEDLRPAKIADAPRLAGPDVDGLKEKLVALYEPLKNGKNLPGQGIHGDANAGNFLYDNTSGSVATIDVATLGQSLNRNEEGTKTGASDVGRFVESLRTSHPGKLASGEFDRMAKAFDEAYFAKAAMKVKEEGEFKSAITFYRFWMQIVAIQMATDTAQITKAKEHIKQLTGFEFVS